jgi:hypothetical protein
MIGGAGDVMLLLVGGGDAGVVGKVVVGVGMERGPVSLAAGGGDAGADVGGVAGAETGSLISRSMVSGADAGSWWRRGLESPISASLVGGEDAGGTPGVYSTPSISAGRLSLVSSIRPLATRLPKDCDCPVQPNFSHLPTFSIGSNLTAKQESPPNRFFAE